MEHSFDVEVAEKIGIIPAVILKNIYFWVEHNRVNDVNLHDGYYWVYNSKKAFLTWFSYLTERQIEYALTKLRDNGYIKVGNYNKNSFDRTLWYTVTDKGYELLGTSKVQNEKTEKEAPEEKPQKAEKKKSYATVMNEPENAQIKEALVKFIGYCRGINYTPKVGTVEKFAETLRVEGKNNPVIAMRIVDQSIKRKWKALYPLKDKQIGGVVSEPFNPEDVVRDENGDPVVF